ncbi:MAG: NAD(P)H-quinone oxidoreductase [Gammaproteobacteria bacterium]|nr:NAD(P)H-quinone oxidoreductase [Gammaproteobacteria bacterium]
MRAIVFDQPGSSKVLHFGNIETPKPALEQILVKVHATALNRADSLQRQGHYPPPPGDSSVLGLEIAGEVIALGEQVTEFAIGDRVFGLVGGGGYAAYCLLDAKMAMRMPTHWDYTYAAAIPEVFLTANETIFELGQLKQGERLLLHAAASGVGTTAIQMAKNIDVQVFATAGSDEKCERVLALGATASLNYKQQDFLPWIMHLTNNEGVDVVEDFVGLDNFERNLAALKSEGRLLQVATMCVLPVRTENQVKII